MLSQHAEHRCQQRGIQQDAMEVVMDFGECRTRSGADVFYMTKSSRAEAKCAMGAGAYSRVADQLDIYVVVSSWGTVMTVAKRLKRMQFH